MTVKFALPSDAVPVPQSMGLTVSAEGTARFSSTYNSRRHPFAGKGPAAGRAAGDPRARAGDFH